MTTRGFKEAEMSEVADLIAEVLNHIGSEECINSVRSRVETLTEKFPLYEWKLMRTTRQGRPGLAPIHMRIAIDARRLRDFGIGTYIRNLVTAISNADHESEYLLVSFPEDEQLLRHLPGNFRPIPCSRLDTTGWITLHCPGCSGSFRSIFAIFH